jgi:ureidoacrylate peracid hydrolase
MNLETKDTALLVIDMQNAFLDDRGSMVRRGFDTNRLRAAVKPCGRLISAARASQVPIIQTRYVYRADYRDAGVRVREILPNTITTESLAAGSWDVEIVDALAPSGDDIVIDKNRPSAFIGTSLDLMLRGQGITSVVICGITTNICVESTARDASQFDYRTFVVSDATAEMEQSRHDHAINTLGFLFARIVTVDEVADAWNARVNS